MRRSLPVGRSSSGVVDDLAATLRSRAGTRVPSTMQTVSLRGRRAGEMASRHQQHPVPATDAPRHTDNVQ